MKYRVAILLLLVSVVGVAEDSKPKGDYDIKRCTPRLISKSAEESPKFHFRKAKGEEYKQSPVIAYKILESGETADSHLKRSSGDAEVDKYALQWVRGLKFNKRPGCGVIESSMDLTVDFR